MKYTLDEHVKRDPRILDVYLEARRRYGESGLNHHNFSHVMRDLYRSLVIAEEEDSVDYSVLIPSVLLHDIGFCTPDFHKLGHDVAGARLAHEITVNLGYDEQICEAIFHYVRAHKGKAELPQTLEAKILYDADVLEKAGLVYLILGGKIVCEFSETIDIFLESVFDKALCADLNQMLLVSKGLDFAIIALVCSGVELLGALSRGKLKPSRELFDVAIDLYFPDRGYKRCKSFFYNLFRCGVAHHAFIKPGTATARNPNFEHYHLKRVFIDGENEPVLFIHPNIFAKHFFEAINNFKRSLEGNSESIENTYSAIEKIYENYPLPDNAIEIVAEIPYSNSNGEITVTKMPLPVNIPSSNVSRF